MSSNNKLQNVIALLGSSVLLYFLVMFSSGCGSDTTTPTSSGTTDTNVKVWESVDIPLAKAVDLYKGVYTAAGDPMADLTVQLSGQVNYYFNSGISTTKLYLVDTAGTTKAAFLSLVNVAAWGSSGAAIDASIFIPTSTQSFGYLTPGMTKLPTYGFYLAGKYPGTTYKPVFGIIHINSVSVGAAASMNVSIKFNKASLNKFTN